MILFNKELLLVHNPKTAGTSLLRFLQERLTGPTHVAGVKEIGTHHPSLSLALGYACAITRNRPQDFRRIIGVIRNPYDREISMYRYFRDVLCASSRAEADLNDPRLLRAVRMAGHLPFPDYLQWAWEEFGTCDIWHSRCFYQTAEGRVPGNMRVLRMEALERELAVAITGLALTGEDGALPRLNVAAPPSAAANFDGPHADLVTRSYEWVFEDGFYAPLPARGALSAGGVSGHPKPDAAPSRH